MTSPFIELFITTVDELGIVRQDSVVRSAKPAFIGIFVCSALCAIAGISFYYWGKNTPPLREGPLIEYPRDKGAQSESQQFLAGNFLIINDVRNLPAPVLRAFTEQNGSRLLMANPGENFRASDLVLFPWRPSMRLIFAGVSSDRCFVHYEKGGRGLSYVVALLQVTSKDRMKPIWRGYCGAPATNLEELRSWLIDGKVRREKALDFSGCKSRPGTGSLHPVAIEAVAEATKLLEPSVERIALAIPRAYRP